MSYILNIELKSIRLRRNEKKSSTIFRSGEIRSHFVNIDASDAHTSVTLQDPRYKIPFFQNKKLKNVNKGINL